MQTDIRFSATNGRQYIFTVYASNSGWNPVGGVYLFARPSTLRSGTWDVFYIGRTDNFSKRLPNHERLNEASRMGATHIAAVVISTESEREQVEREMIQQIRPPLNDHFTSYNQRY